MADQLCEPCRPLPLSRNTGGRPRELSLIQAVLAVERVQVLANAAALDIREDDSIFVRLRRRLRNQRAKQAAPYKVRETQAELDAAGRFRSTPIRRPPRGVFGAIERKVAGEVGISPRQLRRYRGDKDIRALVSKPVWEPSEFEREGRLLFLTRRAINALLSLMTDERRAKNEPVGIIEGRARILAHPPDVGSIGCALGSINPDLHEAGVLQHTTARNHEAGLLKGKFGIAWRFWPK